MRSSFEYRLTVKEVLAASLTEWQRLRTSATGSRWEVLAASDSCPVEAMRHRTKPWYGVQFHPEQSKQTGEKLVSNFVRLVGRV